MSKPIISSTEAGLLSALASITMALRASPGFNNDKLIEAATFFKNRHQPDANHDEYVLALDVLLGDYSNIDEAITKTGIEPLVK